MGISYNPSGLNAFMRKIDGLAKKDMRGIAQQAILDEASHEITRYYGTISTSGYMQGNSLVITFSSPGLWFKEYGTGYVGDGTFPDDSALPTERLEFVSYGQPQHTNGWEYHYHPFTKAHGYWMFGGVKNYGQPARAGVYHTARYIEDKWQEIIRAKLFERE